MTAQPESLDRNDWRTRAIGSDPSVAIAAAPDRRYVQVCMTPAFSHSMGRLATERGMTRESLLRQALADYCAAAWGCDPEELLAQMLTRKGGK